eukprot:2524864-Pyramimonas_sp.AAC.1
MKPTRISAWLSPSLHSLQKICNCRHGLCSRTQKPHIVLTGKAPGGKNWTALAASYPPRLAQSDAKLMIHGSMRIAIRRLRAFASGLDV